jgi:hypothetical protein
MESSVPTFLACGAFFALAFVAIFTFCLAERLREQTPLTCENRTSCAPHVEVQPRWLLICWAQPVSTCSDPT